MMISSSTMVQVMAWPLSGTKPLPEQMLTYLQLDSKEYISVKFSPAYQYFLCQENAFTKSPDRE